MSRMWRSWRIISIKKASCKKKGIKHHYEIEDQNKFRLRAGLEKKIKIREYDSMFKIDSIVRGMRIQTKQINCI